MQKLPSQALITGPINPMDKTNDTNEYHPLKKTYRTLGHGQIRVMFLEPGDFGSPLHASLVHLELEGPGPKYRALLSSSRTKASNISDPISDNESADCYDYECISYAWGAPVFSENLRINTGEVLKITPSLHSALQHLRHKDRVRRLWADAVCIDQSDNAERSEQVANMARFYSCAKRVLVWLGESQESDPLAFATISAVSELEAEIKEYYDECFHITASCTRPQQGKLLCKFHDRLKLSIGQPSGEEPFHRPVDIVLLGLVAVGALYQRPWFSRLWVVQEVALENKDGVLIHSGMHVGSWNGFGQSLELYTKMHDECAVDASDAALSKFKLGKADYYNHSEIFGQIKLDMFFPSEILNGLVYLYDRQSSDARDRVFALYNYFCLEEVSGLHPDYTLTVRDIYHRLTSACFFNPSEIVKGSRFWSWLGIVGTERSSTLSGSRDDMEQWPSWLLRLDQLTPRSRTKLGLYFTQLDSHHQFGGSWVQSLNPVVPMENYKIKVLGRCYARIIEILPDSQWPEAPSLCDDTFENVQLPKIRSWFEQCRDFVQQSLDENELLGLLCCEIPVRDLIDEVREIMITDAIFKQTASHDEDFASLNYEARMTFVGHLLSRLINPPWFEVMDRDRYLCRINGDGGTHFGWVPKSSRANDEVCIIAGAPFPFVVRGGDDGCHRLLGDAFTSQVTLKEALGGRDVKMRSSVWRTFGMKHPWFMNWNSGDEEMRRLIGALGWITIK